MREQHGHLSEYLRVLNELDRKVVTVTFQSAGNATDDKADFDRKVRESLERQTRRAQIAGG